MGAGMMEKDPQCGKGGACLDLGNRCTEDLLGPRKGKGPERGGKLPPIKYSM